MAEPKSFAIFFRFYNVLRINETPLKKSRANNPIANFKIRETLHTNLLEVYTSILSNFQKNY